MYQNCCKKCGSTSLHTEQKDNCNNVGLFCNDCGSYIKWLSKDELRAFEHSKRVKNSENNFIVTENGIQCGNEIVIPKEIFVEAFKKFCLVECPY